MGEAGLAVSGMHGESRHEGNSGSATMLGLPSGKMQAAAVGEGRTRRKSWGMELSWGWELSWGDSTGCHAALKSAVSEASSQSDKSRWQANFKHKLV